MEYFDGSALQQEDGAFTECRLKTLVLDEDGLQNCGTGEGKKPWCRYQRLHRLSWLPARGAEWRRRASEAHGGGGSIFQAKQLPSQASRGTGTD